MNDPLAQFRRKTPVAAAPVGATGAPAEYEAFGARDRVTHLVMRRFMNPWQSPSYSGLLNIRYDGEYGTNFVLVYGYMFVLVRGQNLFPVIAAIQQGSADYIQQFDPERWRKPSDPGAPVIESIDILSPGEVSVGDSGEGGKQLH